MKGQLVNIAITLAKVLVNALSAEVGTGRNLSDLATYQAQQGRVIKVASTDAI